MYFHFAIQGPDRSCNLGHELSSGVRTPRINTRARLEPCGVPPWAFRLLNKRKSQHQIVEEYELPLPLFYNRDCRHPGGGGFFFIPVFLITTYLRPFGIGSQKQSSPINPVYHNGAGFRGGLSSSRVNPARHYHSRRLFSLSRYWLGKRTWSLAPSCRHRPRCNAVLGSLHHHRMPSLG